MPTSPDTTNEPVTLDQVDKAMSHWRTNKSKNEQSSIPDDIWKTFFKLVDEGNHSASKLRSLFGINSAQYKKKHLELCGSNVKKTNIVSTAALCEVSTQPTQAVAEIPGLTVTQAAETKKTINHLKSTHQDPKNYLDTSTIIVECIHPDGRRLKIHTTNQSLDLVMKTFYQSGAQV